MPPLINPQNLPGVVKTLLESTRDEPHIAEQICFALSQLAAGFKDSDTPLFSPYFADIVQALLQQVNKFCTTCLAVIDKRVFHCVFSDEWVKPGYGFPGMAGCNDNAMPQ